MLERSLRKALMLGHNHFGTEHVLLGLVREDEGVAARILTDLQTDAATIRNEVIRMLAVPGGASRTGAIYPGRESRTPSSTGLAAETPPFAQKQERAVRLAGFRDHAKREAGAAGT